MQPSSKRTYQKNFQPSGRKMKAGPWSIVSKFDPVSEKKYLFFTLNSKKCSLLHRQVFSFRTQSALEISPGSCLHIINITKRKEEVELFVRFVKVINPAEMPDASLERIFYMLIKTLARFERHGFAALDLSIHSIGSDQDGNYFLLPNAYALPFPTLKKDEAAAASTIAPAAAFQGLLPNLNDAHAHHVRGLKRIIDSLEPLKSAPAEDGNVTDRFRLRLRNIGARISRDETIPLADIYYELFNENLDPVPLPFSSGRTREEFPAGMQRTAGAIMKIAKNGSGVIVLKGGPFSGKSSVMQQTTRALQASKKWNVFSMNVWDLFCAGPKKIGRRTGTELGNAYLIDNIDENAFIYSDLATKVLKEGISQDNLLILSSDPEHTSPEANEFLQTLQSKNLESFHSIQMPAPPESAAQGNPESIPDPRRTRILGILGRITPEYKPHQDDSIETLAGKMLSLMKEEERQLLEFIAIARFAVPIDAVFSLFHERGKKLSRAVHRLAAWDLIDIKYRYFSQRNAMFVFLSIKHNSIGRLLYMSIPDTRRRNLSRTIPLIAEDYGVFPPFHYLYHLLKAEEKAQAAKFCVSYLREHRDDSRPYFFTFFAKNLAEHGLFDVLPFHGQIFILKELSEDLLKIGHKDRAEKLLDTATAIIRRTGLDEQSQHAQLITSIYLMLVDIWETKGDYNKSLEILLRVKDDLQIYLSIPDQARLLNEIGWLQYRLGDYERSMESCKLSLTSVNDNQYPLIVARALNIMGVIHFNTSRYDEAVSYYERSVFLRKRSEDYNALSASYNNLGLVYQTKGEYEKALDYYNKSLAIKEQQNNKAGIAAGYLNLALMYVDMQNFSEAEEKCRESLEISKEVDNAQLTAENLSTMGDIALKREDYRQAEDYYLQSLEICQKIKIKNEEMGALRRLSMLYIIEKRYEEAEETVSKALKLARLIGSKLENAQIDIILGDLEATRKKNMQAIKLYDRAASSLATLLKNRLAASALAKTGLIHAEGGNILEARQCMDRASDLMRSDIGHEQLRDLVDLKHALSSHPPRGLMPEEASQKLLMAFYELSTLSDYALDRNEFFKKALNIVDSIINPKQCYLAIENEENSFTLFDCRGEETGNASSGRSALFSRTLLLGRILESNSPDVFNILAELDLPDGEGFVSIPLKAMGEDLGCLFLLLHIDRLPLSKEDISFFASLGRQIAGNLRLMFHFEEHIYDEEKTEMRVEPQGDRGKKMYRFENLIGESECMKEIFRKLDKIKNSIPSILIIGESGTGKTELAQAIHYNSPRRNQPFQRIHCSTIPTTLLESELFGHERGAFTSAHRRKLGLCEIANGGTVFLDDTNTIPLEIQKKLLSFLESKNFIRVGGDKIIHSDVRIIAASNEDLAKLCKEGRFREDLYYRLNVIPIYIPPLRERKEDIIAIAQAFLQKRCGERGIPLKTLAPDTIKLFKKASWKGNVRELQNVLERVVLLSDDQIVYPDSLPEDFLKEAMGMDMRSGTDISSLVKEIVELENYSESSPLMPQIEALLAQLMVDHTGAIGKAATFLGITKPTLYTRLQKYKKMEQ